MLGRGIEGCGNTKFAIELQKYIKQTDECVTIAARDKKWGREKTHNHDIIQYHLYQDMQRVKKVLSECDIIIVLSVPPVNAEFETTEAFTEILESLQDKRIAYINCDHKAQSIRRNFYCDIMYSDFFKLCDVVLTHSKGNDLFTVAKEELCVDTSNFKVPEDFAVLNALDFDSYKKYWVPAEEKIFKSVHFIGRSAIWKGVKEMRDLQYNYLMHRNYIMVAEGIENCLNGISWLYTQIKPERIPDERNVICNSISETRAYDNDELLLGRGRPMYVFGSYIHDRAMYRLGRSRFGIELLMLPDKYLPNNMEYAMMELVATGTVPIFRKRWGEIFKVNGKPVIEQDCGAIFVDEKNVAASIDEIELLATDDKLYDERRNKCYEFFKNACDKNVSFAGVMRLINGNNN